MLISPALSFFLRLSFNFVCVSLLPDACYVPQSITPSLIQCFHSDHLRRLALSLAVVSQGGESDVFRLKVRGADVQLCFVHTS
jgi:hypothetical protein